MRNVFTIGVIVYDVIIRDVINVQFKGENLVEWNVS